MLIRNLLISVEIVEIWVLLLDVLENYIIDIKIVCFIIKLGWFSELLNWLWGNFCKL